MGPSKTAPTIFRTNYLELVWFPNKAVSPFKAASRYKAVKFAWHDFQKGMATLTGLEQGG